MGATSEFHDVPQADMEKLRLTDARTAASKAPMVTSISGVT